MLLTLPQELHFLILSFLPYESLPLICQVSKLFRGYYTSSQYWLHRLSEEFGRWTLEIPKFSPGWDSSWRVSRELYLAFLSQVRVTYGSERHLLLNLCLQEADNSHLFDYFGHRLLQSKSNPGSLIYQVAFRHRLDWLPLIEDLIIVDPEPWLLGASAGGHLDLVRETLKLIQETQQQVNYSKALFLAVDGASRRKIETCEVVIEEFFRLDFPPETSLRLDQAIKWAARHNHSGLVKRFSIFHGWRYYAIIGSASGGHRDLLNWLLLTDDYESWSPKSSKSRFKGRLSWAIHGVTLCRDCWSIFNLNPDSVDLSCQKELLEDLISRAPEFELHLDFKSRSLEAIQKLVPKTLVEVFIQHLEQAGQVADYSELLSEAMKKDNPEVIIWLVREAKAKLGDLRGEALTRGHTNLLINLIRIEGCDSTDFLWKAFDLLRARGHFHEILELSPLLGKEEVNYLELIQQESMGRDFPSRCCLRHQIRRRLMKLGR